MDNKPGAHPRDHRSYRPLAGLIVFVSLNGFLTAFLFGIFFLILGLIFEKYGINFLGLKGNGIFSQLYFIIVGSFIISMYYVLIDVIATFFIWLAYKYDNKKFRYILFISMYIKVLIISSAFFDSGQKFLGFIILFVATISNLLSSLILWMATRPLRSSEPRP